MIKSSSSSFSAIKRPKLPQVGDQVEVRDACEPWEPGTVVGFDDADPSLPLVRKDSMSAVYTWDYWRFARMPLTPGLASAHRPGSPSRPSMPRRLSFKAAEFKANAAAETKTGTKEANSVEDTEAETKSETMAGGEAGGKPETKGEAAKAGETKLQVEVQIGDRVEVRDGDEPFEAGTVIQVDPVSGAPKVCACCVRCF